MRPAPKPARANRYSANKTCSCGTPITNHNCSGLCRPCVQLRASAAARLVTTKPPRFCSTCGARIYQENKTGLCQLHRYPSRKRRAYPRQSPRPHLKPHLSPEDLAFYHKLRKRHGYTRNEALTILNRVDLIHPQPERTTNASPD